MYNVCTQNGNLCDLIYLQYNVRIFIRSANTTAGNAASMHGFDATARKPVAFVGLQRQPSILTHAMILTTIGIALVTSGVAITIGELDDDANIPVDFVGVNKVEA